MNNEIIINEDGTISFSLGGIIVKKIFDENFEIDDNTKFELSAKSAFILLRNGIKNNNDILEYVQYNNNSNKTFIYKSRQLNDVIEELKKEIKYNDELRSRFIEEYNIKYKFEKELEKLKLENQELKNKINNSSIKKWWS